MMIYDPMGHLQKSACVSKFSNQIVYQIQDPGCWNYKAWNKFSERGIQALKVKVMKIARQFFN